MEYSEVNLDGYNPPVSLWRLVEHHVPPHELDEVKSMLGVDVVEECLELHNELEMLLEIWRDCRQVSTMSSAQLPNQRLPEPPGMRDRLVQEIKFFIENIKEKTQENGSYEKDDSSLLRSYNKKVISYAINSDSRAPSCETLRRPQSAIGRDGRETPCIRYGSPASDRMSNSTLSSEDIEGMAENLNILKLDEVIAHLRSHMIEEKEWLLQDVKFLQMCIEDENDALLRTITPENEPSITELREERLKLEKDMLSDVFTHQKPLVSHNSMKPASAKSVKSVIPQGPMKAVHTTAPDGIVLSGNVPDSVVIKAQQRLLNEAATYKNQETKTSTKPKIVKVGTFSAGELPRVLKEACQGAYDEPNKSATRPVSSSVTRPSSALRFRSMVMNSRTVGEES